MKTVAKHAIVLIISALTAASCNRAASSKGVEINGVTWAVANIVEPGRFAAATHETGAHHDFRSCFVVENPCPHGWKIPGYSDFDKLTNSPSVSCEWTSVPIAGGAKNAKNVKTSVGTNGKKGSGTTSPATRRSGLKFTDLVNGQTLFLPAAGMINDAGEHCDDDLCCFYWSTAPTADELPAGVATTKSGGYFLHFDWNKAARKGAVADVDKNLRAQYRFASKAARHRMSVRCVKASTAI